MKEDVFLKRFMAFLISIMLLLFFAGCGSEQTLPETERSLFAMNTYMTFTAYGEHAQAALNESEALIKRLEALLSVTDEESEIYRANHSSGQTVSVSQETAELISFALEMSKKTGGALDPTIYPVLTAWGFTTDSKQVPSPEQIAELLQNVGYSRIRLEGTSLTIPEGMEVNHKDEVKGNNCLDNLELLTKKENCNYGTRNARISKANSKPVYQYSLSGVLIKVWNSITEAEKAHYSRTGISECCNGHRPHLKGYIWSFTERYPQTA